MTLGSTRPKSTIAKPTGGRLREVDSPMARKRKLQTTSPGPAAAGCQNPAAALRAQTGDCDAHGTLVSVCLGAMLIP
eukprot:9660611-Alexandrium_andersonii.AAC.1